MGSSTRQGNTIQNIQETPITRGRANHVTKLCKIEQGCDSGKNSMIVSNKIWKIIQELKKFKKQEHGPMDKQTIDNYGISFGIELEAIVENFHKVIVHMIGTQ